MTLRIAKQLYENGATPQEAARRAGLRMSDLPSYMRPIIQEKLALEAAEIKRAARRDYPAGRKQISKTLKGCFSHGDVTDCIIKNAYQDGLPVRAVIDMIERLCGKRVTDNVVIGRANRLGVSRLKRKPNA